jgi:hypothetical protein
MRPFGWVILAGTALAPASGWTAPHLYGVPDSRPAGTNR